MCRDAPGTRASSIAPARDYDIYIYIYVYICIFIQFSVRRVILDVVNPGHVEYQIIYKS